MQGVYSKKDLTPLEQIDNLIFQSKIEGRELTKILLEVDEVSSILRELGTKSKVSCDDNFTYYKGIKVEVICAS